VLRRFGGRKGACETLEHIGPGLQQRSAPKAEPSRPPEPPPHGPAPSPSARPER
jgi:hypothetical protein